MKKLRSRPRVIGDSFWYLAHNLRALRATRSVSQEELANATGLAQQTVSDWEHGLWPTTLQGLIRVAEYFNTSVIALLNLRNGDCIPELDCHGWSDPNGQRCKCEQATTRKPYINLPAGPTLDELQAGDQ